jgi:hypothetical protein
LIRRSLPLASLVALALATPLGTLRADALRGSMRSMVKQHDVAVRKHLDFVDSRNELERLVAAGELVPIEGNADYVVDGQAPYRYGRPEIRLFLERLGAQYHAATGRRLVVTSLLRPADEQPSNAHRLSVHPAGMAIDFRVPAKAGERVWLEKALLGLEQKGVLDVTRERRPPHYHVAVYPAEYAAFVAGRDTSVAMAPVVTAVEPMTTIEAPATEALLTLPNEPTAIDATHRDANARIPVALAGLAVSAGMFGVVRRRRGDRRRVARDDADRRA